MKFHVPISRCAIITVLTYGQSNLIYYVTMVTISNAHSLVEQIVLKNTLTHNNFNQCTVRDEANL